jgi:type IV secretion system protein VirB10
VNAAQEKGSAGGVTGVAGERGETLANAARSVQARVTSAVATVVVIALAASALAFYYARTLTWRSHARELAQSAASARAQGEMSLPSLGPITPPSLAVATRIAEQPNAIVASLPPDMLLEEARARVAPPGSLSEVKQVDTPTGGSEPAKIPAQSTLERRLAGRVLAHEGQPSSMPEVNPLGGGVASAPTAVLGRSGANPDGRIQDVRMSEGLGALLRPSEMAATQAEVLPSGRLLLPKGTFIDCTLETAIDSTLPGMTTCVTAADTFSADGKVVLMERGTKLVGETRGQVQQGQARVFVVWTQARTPTGVIVPLDSPGTDELGRSGLPGRVERHFWDRFGAAMLISLVDGAIQAGVQSLNHSGGTVVYAPSASTDVLTEVLRSTLQVQPTVVKHNGDRIQVLVARDVDFQAVYELRAAAH